MIRRNVRRPALLALVVVVFVGVMGAAFAEEYEPPVPSFPQPGFLDPQLLVTPSDNLTSGQTVQVTGRRFGGDASGGTLRQCTADLTLCTAPTGTFTTGSNAEFNPVGAPLLADDPQTIPVPFVVRAVFLAAAREVVNCLVAPCVITPERQVVNCLVTPCVIFATITQGIDSFSAAHHISFLGSVTPSSTSTSTSTSTSSTTTPTSTSSSTSSTSSSTSTSSTSSSTSSTLAPTTSTIPLPATLICDQLRAQRAVVNAQLNGVVAANPSVAAQVQAYRTLINARIDQELAARGC